MGDYTIMYGGVPHRVRGARSRAIAEAYVARQMADPMRRKMLQKNRIEELKEMGIELDTNGGLSDSAAERFFIGAGRTIDQAQRGVQQLYAKARGRDDEVARLQKQEAEHRELFDKLDSEGVGFEDIGQLAPEILAFAGTGGGSLLAKGAQLAGRGALLGGTKATVEGEDMGINAVLGGAFALGGGAAAGALGGLFSFAGKQGANAFRVSKGVGNQLAKWAKNGNADDVVENLALSLRTAQHMANSGDKAMVEVGESALAQLSNLVGKMNSSGKESVYRQHMKTLMQDAIVEKNGRNVLDYNKFLRSLSGVDRTGLKQALGKTYGDRMADMLETFRSLGKLGDMPADQAEKVLRGVMSDEGAAQVARSLAGAVERGAPEGTVAALRNALATKIGQLEKLNPRFGSASLPDVLKETVQRAPGAVMAGGSQVDATAAERIGNARGFADTMEEVFRGISMNAKPAIQTLEEKGVPVDGIEDFMVDPMGEYGGP